MKHNVFDTDKRDDKSFLSHADQEEILDFGKDKRGRNIPRPRWRSMLMRECTSA